jgi:hypothetical protein
VTDDDLAAAWDAPPPRAHAILGVFGTPGATLFAWAWAGATVLLVGGAAYLTRRMEHPTQRPTLFVAAIMVPIALLAIGVARRGATRWRTVLLDGDAFVGHVIERAERSAWSGSAAPLANVRVRFVAGDSSTQVCRVVLSARRAPAPGSTVRVIFHAPSRLAAVWVPGTTAALGSCRPEVSRP